MNRMQSLMRFTEENDLPVMMGGGDGDIYCTQGSTVSNLQFPSVIILRISINFCHIRFARIITTNIGFFEDFGNVTG